MLVWFAGIAMGAPGWALTRDVPAFTVLGADMVEQRELPNGTTDGLVTESPVGRLTSRAGFDGEFVHSERLAKPGTQAPKITKVPIDQQYSQLLGPDAVVRWVFAEEMGPPQRVVEVLEGAVRVVGEGPPSGALPVIASPYEIEGYTSYADTEVDCGDMPHTPRAKKSGWVAPLTCTADDVRACHWLFAGELAAKRTMGGPEDCVFGMVPMQMVVAAVPATAAPGLGGKYVDAMRGPHVWQAAFVMASSPTSIAILMTQDQAVEALTASGRTTFRVREEGDVKMYDEAAVRESLQSPR